MKSRILAMFLAIAVMIGLAGGLYTPIEAKEVPGLGPIVLHGGRRDFQWPVPAYHNLKSCFYDGRNHCALDIAAPNETPVIASFDGTVIEVRADQNGITTGYGNYVVVQHDYMLSDGSRVTLYSKYNHLNSVSVCVGESVMGGLTVIGGIGSTGYTEGAHLDFQIFKDNYSSKAYSIDPFANELLELPDDLIITDSWDCGRKYYSAVKSLYETDSASYLTKCTIMPMASWANMKAGKYEKTLPCSIATDKRSLSMNGDKPLPENATVRITGVIKNSVGNTWYRIFYQGYTGYLFHDQVKNIRTITNEMLTKRISVQSLNVPLNLKAGHTYSLYGTVNSTFGNLTKMTVGVFDGNGKMITGATAYPNTKTFDVHSLDNSVLFDILGEGRYYYRILASVGNETKCVVNQPFSVSA